MPKNNWSIWFDFVAFLLVLLAIFFLLKMPNPAPLRSIDAEMARQNMAADSSDVDLGETTIDK